MTRRGHQRMFRLKSAVTEVVAVTGAPVKAGQSYAEALLRGDAVPTSNLFRSATDAALRRYHEQLSAIRKRTA